jgi:uncharacterized protein YecT (DUF1311 family)
MKIRAPILVIGLLAAFLVLADDAPQRPIDVWYAKAMDKTNGSTFAMIDVESQAYEKWDAELNIVYKRLLWKLDSKGQQSLRESERNWITWRQSESKFSTALWNKATDGQPGTLDRYAELHMEVELVRERVLLLLGYEDALASPP